MNRLETYLREHGLDEVGTMNRLQDAGVISDNCIDAADVSDLDAISAISSLSLSRHQREFQLMREAIG